MNVKLIGAMVCSLAFTVSANAAELLLTQGTAKKNQTTSMAIDIVSDGDITSFDFIVPVEKGVKVDVSNCMNKLPHGFQGGCKFNGTEVAGIAFSTERKTLPAGIHSFGSISFSGRSLKTTKTKNEKITFNSNNIEAKSILSKVIVE